MYLERFNSVAGRVIIRGSAIHLSCSNRQHASIESLCDLRRVMGAKLSTVYHRERSTAVLEFRATGYSNTQGRLPAYVNAVKLFDAVAVLGLFCNIEALVLETCTYSIDHTVFGELAATEALGMAIELIFTEPDAFCMLTVQLIHDSETGVIAVLLVILKCVGVVFDRTLDPSPKLADVLRSGFAGTGFTAGMLPSTCRL